MVLRNQIEWALHCCSLLMVVPSGRYLPTKDLAEFHKVPKEYLSKAMQALSQAGIVNTTLGPKGGYSLAKPPDQITFLDIVEAIEGRRSTFQCSEIRKNNPCRPKVMKDTGVCAVAKVMYDADEAWRSHLREMTLEKLSESLMKQVPREILEKGADWVSERT